MPISTPNRDANPPILESYDPVCIVRQPGGLNIPFQNITGETLMAGEIAKVNGKACIVVGTTLDDQEGRVITEWIADVILDPDLVGDILAGDEVYLDYDLIAIEDGMGAATGTEPTNGIHIGYAVRMPGETRVNGYGKPIAATAGDLRIRVMSNPEVAEKFGTIPTFE